MADGVEEQQNTTSGGTIQPDVIINPAAGGLYKSQPSSETTIEPNKPSEEAVSQIKKNESRGGEIIINRVSTYQDAVKEALRTQSVSSASLLMAEDRRRKTAEAIEENESIKTPRNRWFLIGTIVLVLAGLSVLGFVFFSRNNSVQTDTTRSITAQKFFEPNDTVELASANLARNTLSKLQQVLASPLEQNIIQQIVITKEVAADPTSAYTLTKTAPYTTDEFLSLIKARVDTSFNRSVDQVFFLGNHGLVTNETFIVFKINDFDTVFAAMFAWEKSLPDDIMPIFPKVLGAVVDEETKINTGSIDQSSNATTSTSTVTQVAGTTTDPESDITSQLPQRTTAGLFSDEVISNSDARVIKDVKKRVIFFYAFIDEEYLFIGTKPQTLTEIKKRIRSAKLVM
jgi:hypothetical protein